MTPQDNTFAQGYLLEGILSEERYNDLVDAGYNNDDIKKVATKLFEETGVAEGVAAHLLEIVSQDNKVKEMVLSSMLGEEGYKSALNSGAQPADISALIAEFVTDAVKAKVARNKKGWMQKVRNASATPITWGHVGILAGGILLAVAGYYLWERHKATSDVSLLIE